MTQSASTVLNERFELRARLFSEGNQAAYAARDRARGEDVLLFLIPSSQKLAEKVDAAVRADIEKAFQVEAPTILPLLDLGDSGGYRYLIMPKPSGVNAWSRITEKKKGATRFDTQQAITAGDDLIAAAQAAHAADTILGFSPKQVWIDPRGAADVQYYWLERVNLAASDATGSFQTLAAEGGYFQAPELGQGSAGAKPPADQFFIGAILYGLLTGEVPGGTLAPIRRSRKDVPKPLAAAVEKALSRDPAKRHADLDAFRQALHRKRARLGYLVPLLLLLVGLWAGAAVLLGGASVDDWQFPAETEARRQAAFEASKPEAEPVARADAETLARWAGHYVSDTEGVEQPRHELTLGTDGTFRLVDRSGEQERVARGLYHREGDVQGGVVLRPARSKGGGATIMRALFEPGGLALQQSGGGTAQLKQVGWPGKPGRPMQPLFTLESPHDGTVVGDGKVRVAGRVAVAGTKISIPGAPVINVVGTRFETVVDVEGRGPVQLHVDAQSPWMVAQRITRTLVRDSGPPQIEVDGVLGEQDGLWSLAVRGRVVDDGAVARLTVNDEPVKLADDGTFSFVRKGADALQYAFAEIVATDDAGRRTRRVLWSAMKSLAGADFEEPFAAVAKALEAGKNDQVENLLREIRALGGLIEQLPPERLTPLVHSGRPPRISFDDHPNPPAYFDNDGTQQITLSGRIDSLAPGDTLTIAGRATEIEDGRFTLRFALPKLGPNTVNVRVLRDGQAVAERALEVWIAAEDGAVPEWTGVPVDPLQRSASARYGLPIGIEDRHGLRFVLIPPGTFTRETATGRRFEVRITKPFYLQTREVSRDLFERTSQVPLSPIWKALSGNLPVSGPDRPAMGMSRDDVLAFAEKLGDAEHGYTLPTEAQWELAARAGSAGQTYWGLRGSEVAKWANFADRSIQTILTGWPDRLLMKDTNDQFPGTWPVSRGRSNAFGLKNMLGNAAEWTRDDFVAYDPQAFEDPVGSGTGREGVVRGGSFNEKYIAAGFGVRARARSDQPEKKKPTIGVRLVLIPRGR